MRAEYSGAAAKTAKARYVAGQARRSWGAASGGAFSGVFECGWQGGVLLHDRRIPDRSYHGGSYVKKLTLYGLYSYASAPLLRHGGIRLFISSVKKIILAKGTYRVSMIANASQSRITSQWLALTALIRLGLPGRSDLASASLSESCCRLTLLSYT